MAVMSAILQFNSGASSRHAVMNAASIPAGKFTNQGSARKSQSRITSSAKKASTKEKERRRKIRQAKLAARTEEAEGERSYSSGKFNEIDPLGQTYSSDEDGYLLARLLHESDLDSFDTSDDVPQAQLYVQTQ